MSLVESRLNVRRTNRRAAPFNPAADSQPMLEFGDLYKPKSHTTHVKKHGPTLGCFVFFYIFFLVNVGRKM